MKNVAFSGKAGVGTVLVKPCLCWDVVLQLLIKTVAQNGAGNNYIILWQVLAGSNKISYLKQIIFIVSL
jgi:hypothetical protein